MLRNFCGTQDTSPKSNLTKEKTLPRQTSENRLSLVETDLAIAIPKARGLNPCPGPDANDATSRATVCDLFYYLVRR